VTKIEKDERKDVKDLLKVKIGVIYCERTMTVIPVPTRAINDFPITNQLNGCY